MKAAEFFLRIFDLLVATMQERFKLLKLFVSKTFTY